MDFLEWLELAENLIEEEDFEAAKKVLEDHLNSGIKYPAIAECEALRLIGFIFNQQEEFTAAEKN